MQLRSYNLLRFLNSEAVIAMEDSEILSEISIDHYHFKVTLNPIEEGSCILWFKDARIAEVFEALGKFSRFDKRNVLDFIVRYATNVELREEIEHRQFAQRVENLPPEFFRLLERLDEKRKEAAFRSLYDLDDIIEPTELARKRRIMARKFHPDAGGNSRAMSVINEAYEYLAARARP